MAKVTMQQVAEAMNVSRITVWKALSNRPGVSETLRDQIVCQATAMGYTNASGAVAEKAKERTVSVVVSRPESSTFWMEIIHHIAKELSRHNINLMYTYMPTTYKEGYTLPSSLNSNAVDGFIVLNIYNEHLLQLLAAQKLPKVFLDTVPTVPIQVLNGDLLLIEGRSRVCEITSKLLAKGMTKLGFIGDVRYAQTNEDRYLGFLDAYQKAGKTVDKTLSFTQTIQLRSHYEDISRFLDGLTAFPDAFVCASDFIAHFVQQYLAQSERDIPETLILTGFDNNSEYHNIANQITTVDVQTAFVGKRLADKMMFRVDNPTAPLEVSYVLSDILYRGALLK